MDKSILEKLTFLQRLANEGIAKQYRRSGEMFKNLTDLTDSYMCEIAAELLRLDAFDKLISKAFQVPCSIEEYDTQ